MDDEDDEVDPTLFDRLILQVFEEQEERCGSLRYPLSTQRHALDFVKLINRKGFPYVLMCQAINEKQEKFRSWRLGNGNAYVGQVMMKRINKTVQEAMMLPDADVDVDINDLIDDDDDDETEIGDNDLTTDEDEHHPTTSSSSSPAPTERVDDEVSIADRGASRAADTTDCDTTSSTHALSTEDDVSKDETESQASVTELQSNKQQHQQPSINTDDVKLTSDNTGTRGVDLPDPSLATNELQTEDIDTSRREDVEVIVDQSRSPQDKDFANSLVENQRETCNDSDEKDLIYSSDKPDANQQVCQSTAAESIESGEVIPSTSSSSSATVSTSLSSSSSEQPQHAEIVSTPQQEPQSTSEDQEKDEENDVKYISETKDQTETLQLGRVATDENDQNDLLITSQSELKMKTDLEPDTSTTQTQEDHSAGMTEKQEQILHVETVVDLERRSLTNAGDEVTSQQDTEVGHEEVKVRDELEVTQQAKVTEEVKVTYEASAKQLDLLSRLSMLREKASQRKASDTVSTQDSHETPFCEDRGLSTHRDDSTKLHDQSGSPQQQQNDAPQILTKNDVNRRSVEINIDKETSLETDKQRVIATVNTDTEQQYREGTGSPSCGIVLVEDKSQQSKLFSKTTDHCRSTGSSSLETPNDPVETEAKTQRSDNNCLYAADHVSLSTTDQSSTQIHSEPRDGSTAEALNVQLKATDSGSDKTNRSTEETVDLNVQLELSRGVPYSTNTDLHKQDEFCSSFAAMDSTVELQPANRGLHQPELTQTMSDTEDSNISDATTVADFNVQSVQSDSGETRSLTTYPTDTGKLPESVDSSSYLRGPDEAESAKALSDAATSEPSNATTLAERSSITHITAEPSSDVTATLDTDIGDAAVNYDSDLDREFADPGALQLLLDIETLKLRVVDGPGHLYVLADPPRRRFTIGASRSPANRLRQATVLNPDVTLLISLPVSGRLAALRQLRRRLVANHSRDVIAAVLPGSRDWFTGSDDVMTELVTQVAAADTTNN